MSVRDYAQFKERLRREFPDDQFLIVRFGDHQPLFAKRFMEPALEPGRGGAAHSCSAIRAISPPTMRPRG